MQWHIEDLPNGAYHLKSLGSPVAAFGDVVCAVLASAAQHALEWHIVPMPEHGPNIFTYVCPLPFCHATHLTPCAGTLIARETHIHAYTSASRTPLGLSAGSCWTPLRIPRYVAQGSALLLLL